MNGLDNYDWSYSEDGKKGCKQTNYQTIIDISNGLLIRLLTSSRLPIGQLNKPVLTNDNCQTVYTKLEG